MLQVLERLGAPLLAAACDVAARSGGAETPREAERLAELLAKSVQASLALAGTMALKEKDGTGDAGRLALTALAAGLVGGQYRQTARVPDEAEIKRMVAALEAVMTFADNFTPAAENTLRLQGLEPGFFPADENQIHIQYLNAFVPVVGAVSAFSFGKQDKKLLQEIAARLCAQAAALRAAAAGSGGEKADRMAELKILGGLVDLYVQCHMAETQRLMALDEAARAQAQESGGLSLDPVWQAFDLRVSMLEALCGSILPDLQGAGPAPEGVPTPFDSPAAAVSAPAVAAAPVSAAAPPPQQPVAPPQAEPVAPAEPAAPAGQENYNPMSFFRPGAKKPDEDSPQGDRQGGQDGAAG